MYITKEFEEPRVEILYELIRARPLATIATIEVFENSGHI
jgi:transcriptional regulator